MHVLKTTELAAIIVQYGAGLIYHRDLIPNEALNGYWVASRQRFDLWHQALGSQRKLQTQGTPVQLGQWWETNLPLLEEILLAEMLTRVYAALGAGLERQHPTPEVAPILDSVFQTHLEARQRVLRLMLCGRGSRLTEVLRLDRLRRQVERWTDTLIGGMAATFNGALRYAHNQRRAVQQAEVVRNPSGDRPSADGFARVDFSMQAILNQHCSPTAALPRLNRQVQEAVMVCLRPDLFDSVDRMQTLWIHRLEAGSEQAARLLDASNGDPQGSLLRTAYAALRDPRMLRRLM